MLFLVMPYQETALLHSAMLKKAVKRKRVMLRADTTSGTTTGATNQLR